VVGLEEGVEGPPERVGPVLPRQVPHTHAPDTAPVARPCRRQQVRSGPAGGPRGVGVGRGAGSLECGLGEAGREGGRAQQQRRAHRVVEHCSRAGPRDGRGSRTTASDMAATRRPRGADTQFVRGDVLPCTDTTRTAPVGKGEGTDYM
jgi:hypothetical protein